MSQAVKSLLHHTMRDKTDQLYARCKLTFRQHKTGGPPLSENKIDNSVTKYIICRKLVLSLKQLCEHVR
jgi:hypothetical protein